MSAQDDPLACPAPWSAYDKIVLAHGGGGRATLRLVEDVFARAFDSDELRQSHDGAVLSLEAPIAVSTDAFTVRPLFFPGGDIGSLAVHGSVNDLACCGARPSALTAAFVLEEGLPLATLVRVVQSMASAAKRCGVRVVAGDTKVVERGRCDGMYIAVTGLGTVRAPLAPAQIRAGQHVLVSGPVGDHGIAVLLARGDLRLDAEIESDSGEVSSLVHALIDAGVRLACARDATRGGLATVLCELARTARVDIEVEEQRIPVRPVVADACELFGLDPLYVACEGRVALFVEAEDADRALSIMRRFDAQAADIGAVREGSGVVLSRGPFGGERVLDLLSGEQLPRIC